MTYNPPTAEDYARFTSQKATILAYLQSGAALTQDEAKERWGVMRLASRIEELRDDGWNIPTEMIPAGENGATVAKYHLEGQRAPTGGEGVYAAIPVQIRAMNRFVLWRYEQIKERTTKIPYRTTGRKAQTNNPQTWNTFRGALAILEENKSHFSGLGFVLGDGVAGIDLDKVILEDGTLRPEAAQIVAELPGYVEKSPSGTGLHILTRGSLPKDRERLKFTFEGSDGKKFEFEFYDETSPRYLTLTGDVWENRAALNDEDATETIEDVFRCVEVAFNAKKSPGKEKKQNPVSAPVAVTDIDDETLLNKARRSRNGTKFSALHDRGQWQEHFPSASEGVGSLLGMLAFWTGKDEARMDRLFRASAMYNSEKWDRTQRGSTLGAIEIQGACQRCSETYNPQRLSSGQNSGTAFIDFPDVTRTGAVKATLPNLRALLDFHEIKAYYDEIKKENRILFRDGSPYSIDNHSEAALAELTSLLEVEEMPTRNLTSHLCAIADVNRINPVKQWILSEPWDGVDRLVLLCDTIKAASWFSNDMKELMIRKWLLSSVAAACHDPWEKPFSSRGVLVLAGPQGKGKTRWIRSLAPAEWVRDGLVLDPANKDSVREAVTHWICELGELESTLRPDLGRLKAFLTKENDQFRLPYARAVSCFPRRVVFAASVNKPDFLVDRTGNDRFWTIPVESVRYDHGLKMQQIFAQLYEICQKGAQWWLTPEESRRLSNQNEVFEERDEVFDLLVSRIKWESLERCLEINCVDWLSATDILMSRCGFLSIPTKGQRNSCAQHLRKLTGGRELKKKLGLLFPVPKAF